MPFVRCMLMHLNLNAVTVPMTETNDRANEKFIDFKLVDECISKWIAMK